MRILFLDDNSQNRRSLKEWLSKQYSGIELDMVDNLMDFHELLRYSTEQYDKVIMDLGIKKSPDIIDNEYDAFLHEIELTPKTMIYGESIIGWDYYEQVMPKMMPKLYGTDWKSKVLLKSGYIDFLSQQHDLSDVGTLGKGDPNYFNKLKVFIDR